MLVSNMAYKHIVRNPRLQARIFLPEWFMKVVRPRKEVPDNVAMFHVPMQMSRIDVKNYLESIYQINVAKVNVQIQAGKTERIMMKNGAVKSKRHPDIKVVYVTMADTTFKFPELFVKSKKSTLPEAQPADKKPEEFRWF